MNIALDPLKRRDLILKGISAGALATFLAQFGMGEKPEGAKSVGNADQHDAILSEARAIEDL